MEHHNKHVPKAACELQDAGRPHLQQLGDQQQRPTSEVRHLLSRNLQQSETLMAEHGSHNHRASKELNEHLQQALDEGKHALLAHIRLQRLEEQAQEHGRLVAGGYMRGQQHAVQSPASKQLCRGKSDSHVSSVCQRMLCTSQAGLPVVAVADGRARIKQLKEQRHCLHRNSKGCSVHNPEQPDGMLLHEALLCQQCSGMGMPAELQPTEPQAALHPPQVPTTSKCNQFRAAFTLRKRSFEMTYRQWTTEPCSKAQSEEYYA